MLKKINKYWQIWRMIATRALQETMLNRWTNLVFFLGKAVRFIVSITFLFIIKDNLTSLAGYNAKQIVVFFIIYNLIDLAAQVLYRGTYTFQEEVRTGNFDLQLVKPIHPLWQALIGKPDINDFFFLLVSGSISLYLINDLGFVISGQNLLIFAFLFLNSMLIATALHILVLSATVYFVQIDNLIWIYRDTTRMGQYPVKIYQQPLKAILSFVIPVAFMMTIPAEALLGVKPSYSLSLTFSIGLSTFLLSLFVWKKSLKKYSSASS
ncbi:MAG: ABC transporter permease [Patescibacteria group bacterium]